MKQSDALKLRDGDLIDLNIPLLSGGCQMFRAAKVLIVTSHGGIFFAPPSRRVLSQWTWCRWAKALGRREELTDRERLLQLSVTARFNAYRIDLLRQPPPGTIKSPRYKP